MLVLLDQNTPRALARLLPGHQVKAAAEMGWAALANSDLLAAAERVGFQVMITADQNLRYQQNLIGRRIALVILSSNHWPTLRANAERLLQGLEGVSAGSYREVVLSRPKPGRRSAPE